MEVVFIFLGLFGVGVVLFSFIAYVTVMYVLVKKDLKRKLKQKIIIPIIETTRPYLKLIKGEKND